MVRWLGVTSASNASPASREASVEIGGSLRTSSDLMRPFAVLLALLLALTSLPSGQLDRLVAADYPGSDCPASGFLDTFGLG